MRRIAETCHEGAVKYSDHNWERGMPVNDLLKHAIRHVYLYLGGDRSEDHLSHAGWGLLAAMHSDELWTHANDRTLRLPGCRPPMQMLVEGRPKGEIKEFFRVNYSVGYRTTERYTRLARERRLKQVGVPKEVLIAESFGFLLSVLRDPKANWRDKIAARKEANAFMGLNAPTKIAPTTPEGKALPGLAVVGHLLVGRHQDRLAQPVQELLEGLVIAHVVGGRLHIARRRDRDADHGVVPRAGFFTEAADEIPHLASDSNKIEGSD